MTSPSFEELSVGGTMHNPLKLTLALSLALQFVPAVRAQRYKVTDLGTLPGGTTSQAAGINGRGQVVGAASVPQGTHAFLWKHSEGMQDLGTLPGGGVYSAAAGINFQGRIAGTSDFSQPFMGNTHAFVWTQRSGMQDIGTLGCPDITGANGINVFSEVVGVSTIAPCPGGGQYRAFAFFATSDGVMQNLGTLPGGDFSIGFAINFYGHVVGYAGLSSRSYGTYHAFLWTTAADMQDLGTLSGGDTSQASGINSFDSVVGGSNSRGSLNQLQPFHAVLWSKDGEMKDLGMLPGGNFSIAFGINDRNEVVGDSQYANSYSSATHAFIWSPAEGMQDLNDLIKPKSGWVLVDARAINEVGQIVGSGTIRNQTHAFLLKPRGNDDDAEE